MQARTQKLVNKVTSSLREQYKNWPTRVNIGKVWDSHKAQHNITTKISQSTKFVKNLGGQHIDGGDLSKSVVAILCKSKKENEKPFVGYGLQALSRHFILNRRAGTQRIQKSFSIGMQNSARNLSSPLTPWRGMFMRSKGE